MAKVKKRKSILPDYKFTAIIISLILPAAILFFWYIGSGKGAFNESIIPTPHKIAVQFEKMISDGSLVNHIITSFRRVITGYLLGAGIGVILGLFIGLYTRLNQFFIVLIGLLRPIPPIACIPLFIMIMGIGEGSKIALIFIGAFWPCLLNTISGIHATNQKLIEVARVFGKNKLIILKDTSVSSTFDFYRSETWNKYSMVLCSGSGNDRSNSRSRLPDNVRKANVKTGDAFYRYHFNRTYRYCYRSGNAAVTEKSCLLGR